MSDIYKEALIEAKKIKEVAEADAKRKIVEQVAPIIKQMITKEVAMSNAFFFEEDDDTVSPDAAPPVPPAPEGDVGVDAPPPDAAMPPETAPEASTDLTPPVSAVGASVGSDIMDIALPDKDGMYVVDINKLWAAGPDETEMMAGAVAPADGLGAPDASLGAVPTPPVSPTASADLGAGGLPAPELATAGGAPAPEAPPPAPAPPGAEAPPPPPPPPGEEEEEVPPPPPPVAESVTYDRFKNGMHEIAMRIDEAYYARKMPYVVSEGIKHKLFGLLEQLDSLVERGVITTKQAKLNENRLEFLFMKLKEAKVATSYSQKGEKDLNMKSLKEFAAKLFENEDQERLAQDTQSTGKTGEAVHKSATAHAQKVDGVQADLFEGSTDTQDKPSGEGVLADGTPVEGTGEPEKKAWEDGDPLAEGHEGFGDSSEKPVAEPFTEETVFEVDEKELKEAIRALRKKALKESDEGHLTPADAKAEKGPQEKAKPEGKPVKHNVTLEEQLEEDSIELDLPDGALADVGEDDIDIELMLGGGEEEGEEDLDMLGGEDDEEELEGDLELSGDEGEEELDVDSELDAGGEDERMVLHDEEEDLDSEEEPELDEMSMMMESRRRRALTKAIKEAVARKLAASKKELRKPMSSSKTGAYKRLAESRTKELSTLKKEMAETNLFLSKVMLLNKFLQRGDLSKKQQQAIVEHLDRATTIAEAKMVYEKIKTKLNESATKKDGGAKVTGSASKPVAPASATVDADKVLTESVIAGGNESGDVVIGNADRWAVLVKGGRD